ncbi:MAG: hypothetical protein CL908_11470 [Deltaproteobacteria bacterium]|nr:hypothetical protein [Deltaproteobacteria bacterium]
MANRFSSRLGRNAGIGAEASRGDGLGDWWAAVSVIALAAMAIIGLSGSALGGSELNSDSALRIHEVLRPAADALAEIESAFETLCQEPLLVGLELEPDCETGVITLRDDLFEDFGNAQLSSEGREYVTAAMTTYLSRLRRLPALWSSIEAIEVRGHSDPRAVRDPYATNMVGSQQRALGVMLFLVGPDGLSEMDRELFQRLAMVSGASFSRPPAHCPEPTRECYPQWRRVEIMPVLSESLRRGDWARTVESVRRASMGIREESRAQKH